MNMETKLMKRRFLLTVFLLPLALVCSFIIAREWKQKVFGPHGESLPVYSEIGSFELTERSGALISNRDLLGKVWIADFIFTRCGGPCPLMSANMKNLETALTGQNIKLVSFTVDPEHDTPERLTVYANRFGSGAESWLFLTGEKKMIHDLSRQHFLLGVTEIPEEERQNSEDAIMHSTRFVLVDEEGRIRGYYESTEPGALEKLVRDAKALAQNP